MAKIMIIEDYGVHNILLCHNMEDIGHEPISFFDVESAKEELNKHTIPDLFIIDMQIGNYWKPTLEFVKELKKKKQYKKIPIIIISAYVNKDEIEKEFPKFEKENVISKPFNVDTISAKVKELLKGKK
jgi:CheY-like chemotaxis protein